MAGHPPGQHLSCYDPSAELQDAPAGRMRGHACTCNQGWGRISSGHRGEAPNLAMQPPDVHRSASNPEKPARKHLAARVKRPTLWSEEPMAAWTLPSPAAGTRQMRLPPCSIDLRSQPLLRSQGLSLPWGPGVAEAQHATLIPPCEIWAASGSRKRAAGHAGSQLGEALHLYCAAAVAFALAPLCWPSRRVSPLELPGLMVVLLHLSQLAPVCSARLIRKEDAAMVMRMRREGKGRGRKE